jgi:hypothetical protein
MTRGVVKSQELFVADRVARARKSPRNSRNFFSGRRQNPRSLRTRAASGVRSQKQKIEPISEIGADLSILGFAKQGLFAALEPAAFTGGADQNEVVPRVGNTTVISASGTPDALGQHRLDQSCRAMSAIAPTAAEKRTSF